jgi:LysR family transcriptional regulator, mexEF-oprN operon transcriptional activator
MHAISTIPAHAARAIAATTPLNMRACPGALPGYSIELDWRMSAQRDPAIMSVRDAVVICIGRLGEP